MKVLISLVILLFSFNLLADSRIPDPLQPLSEQEVQDVSSGVFNYFSIESLDWKGYNNDSTKRTMCRLKLSVDLNTGLYHNNMYFEYRENSKQDWSSLNKTYMVFDKVIERKFGSYTEFVFYKEKDIKDPEYKGQILLLETAVRLSHDEKRIINIKYSRSTQKRKNVGTIRSPKYEITYLKDENKTVVCSL